MRLLSAFAVLVCAFQVHCSAAERSDKQSTSAILDPEIHGNTQENTINYASSSSSPLGDSLHEAGRCAMYDNCGKRSIFGAPLPCPTNQKALPPSPEVLDILHRVCGADFPAQNVCCLMEQLTKLEDNLKKVDPLISSCPACRKNFYDFFCKFTCSPDQLQFTKITGTAKAVDTGKDVVTELTQYVDPGYAAGFFNSCKDLKFSATNGYAMDLIGGGAKDYRQFLKFLGDEKPLLGGLPFQINFQYETDKGEDNEGLVARNGFIRPCDDPDYKCACSDCPVSCPALPTIRKPASQCKVGQLHCFSFAVVMVWLGLFLALGVFHIYWARVKKDNFDHINDIYEENEFDNDDLDFVVSAHSLRPYGSGILAPLRDFQSHVIGVIEMLFAYTGYFCASYPAITIVVSLAIAAAFSGGLFFLQLETDPVRLWVSPEDPAVKEKEYFEANFGEWFRVELIIVSSKTEQPVLSWENIEWWFEKETELFSLRSGNETLDLETFCFKPLDETCALQSFTQYFDGQISNVDKLNWQTQLKGCTDSPVNCLPSFQQPLKPNILFSDDNPLKAQAFIITILIESKSSDPEYTAKVQQYERSLKEWVLEMRNNDKLSVNVDFNTEVSLTDELSKFSKGDINTIAVSYLVMFVYASLALAGRIPTSFRAANFVMTRFQLGLSGIIIIIVSVLASAGVFAFFGVKSTLIIAEVIPFLVLAIGVDNIFLIVHELNVVNDATDEVDIPTRISVAMGKVGPSCLISAVLQISMFLLAANVSMPAVKNFAFYSAGAVLFTFLLQMTAFVSILALDQRRLEEGRVDCAPFIKTSVRLQGDENESGANMDGNHPKHMEYDFSLIIRKRYAPWLLQTSTKRKVLTAFVLWLGVSLSVLPNISLGLDQRMAVPVDSYLVDFFNAAYKYLNVGPPVFFVAKNLDLTVRQNQKKLCGKFSACDEFSVANILEQEYRRASESSIVEPVSNWIDDFFNWLNPNLDQCCRLKKLPKTSTTSTLTSTFSKEREFCSPYAPSRACESCYENHDPPFDMSMEGLPQGSDFMFYFNQWIQEPSDPCPLGGRVTYGSSVSVDQENNSIISSYLRTSHRPLRSQDDFIDALRQSKRILEEIKHYEGKALGEVNTKKASQPEFFAFSPFYVFFVQYESIVRDVFILLLSALAIIWIVSTILLGSVRVATILVVTVTSIISSLGGIMSFWLISLNAVSLVNLIICAGLSVEFTIHIARAYIVSEVEDNEEILFNSFMSSEFSAADARTLKAYNALATVGGSVLRGITITKFIGIAVLAFTTSKIFEVYYFRMWFALVIVAGVHALVLLPVLLSMFGDVTTRKGRYENGIFST